MIDIPYEVRDVAKTNSKPSKYNPTASQIINTMQMGTVGGQKPWIEFSGVETDESSKIIEVLSKVR